MAPREEQPNCGPSKNASKAACAHARWVILLLTCGGLFGQFYAFDIPSALNLQLGERLMRSGNLSQEQYAYYFNLLYSVYSVPNVVLPLAMGIAVDRWGCRRLIVLLALCVVGGQVLFAAGVSTASWPMMLAGRALFGVGGESLQVAQNCLLFRWFKGREVAFALGLNLSVARFGSVLNDVWSPLLSQYCGVPGTLWFGALLCLLGCACNLLSALLDYREGQRAALPEATEEEKFSMQDLFRMPKLYWLLSLHCLVIYCSILPFNNIASAFFVETFFAGRPLGEAQVSAGRAMAMLFLASALGTPPFGFVVDLIGKRSHFLVLSSLVLTLSYSVIFVASPMISMLLLGLVYMVFAGALWPAFALTVPQKELGTAFGVAAALQNCGLAIMPLLVGHLQEATGSIQGQVTHFAQVIRLFQLLGVCGTLISVMIHITNTNTRGVLDLPSNEAELSLKELGPLRNSDKATIA